MPSARPEAAAPGKGERPTVQLQPVSFSALAGWAQDDQVAALRAFLQSCHRIAPDAIGGNGWPAVCTEARQLATFGPDRKQVRRFFETRFVPYLITEEGRDTGLVTGYFEPELQGAWHRTPRFRYPIYGVPPDLVAVDLGQFRDELRGQSVVGRVSGHNLVPYATRRQIRRGFLAGHQLELLWLDNQVDAFFLHIQGSGRIMMDDGQTVRVGFAGRNGHSYYPIGRALAASGAIPAEKMSLQSIRAWLNAHPQQAQALMDRNASYIFFRFNTGPGPRGAMGAALTPGRSLAVDPKELPLGAPVWLETTDPLPPNPPIHRLMVAQDTGAAILGGARGDFFWGSGKDAEARAGRMRQQGRFYLLLPKTLRRGPSS